MSSDSMQRGGALVSLAPSAPMASRSRRDRSWLCSVAAACLLAVAAPLSAQPTDALAAIKAAKDGGELDRAVSLAKQALDAAPAAEKPVRRGRILNALASVYIDQNRYGEAGETLDEAMAVLEPRGVSSALGRVHFNRAKLHRYKVEYTLALQWLRRAEATFNKLNDQVGLSDVYSLYGIINRFLGQFEQSLNWHSRSLALARALGDDSGVASGLYNIASIHDALGEHDKALSYYENVLALDQATGSPRNMAYSYLRIGLMQLELKRFDEARDNMVRARDLFAGIETPRDHQWAVASLAKLDAAEGRLEEARATLEGVLDKALAGPWPVLINRTRMWLAEVEHKAERYDLALDYLQVAMTDARAQNSRLRVLNLQERQVAVYEAAGRPVEALTVMREQQALEKTLSDSLRASVLASMQGEAEFERQAVALKLAEKQRELSALALQRESALRIGIVVTLLVAFTFAFLCYGRFVSRRQNRVLKAEVAQTTQALRHRNDELERAYDAVERASVTDPLTGLANRRFLERNIEADAARSRRLWTGADGSALACPAEPGDLVFFLLDIDRFKSINDRHGHAAGDAVLVEISRILEREFRQEDFKVRWGGEEFLIVARFIDRRQAAAIAGRVCDAVAAHAFPIEGQPPLRCTCSIGFSAYPLSPAAADAATWRDVVELADHAMYLVKQGPRNGWAGIAAQAPVVVDAPLADWAPQALADGRLAAVSSFDTDHVAQAAPT
ncbi:MAG: tetratricopeptide repeat-containing diguanylate cyclase [Pseudomonadota bacterium]